MTSTLPPRAVVVTRPTEYEELLHHHATRAMAAFFLSTRGRRVEDVEEAHRVVRGAVDLVLGAIPLAWRRALVARSDLDRFLFEPEDVVVTVGQDGLVANVAKYVKGQIVIGINPSPAMYDGVLARHRPRDTADLVRAATRETGARRGIEERTMVEAALPDGQRLLALNEVYLGHRTHQSSRYVLSYGEASERHSSSGIVVATGTGATGWARSIHGSRRSSAPLPAPTAESLVFFVREAFPSVKTGTTLVDGTVAHGAALHVASEMNEGGVVFGDGIEEDHLDLPYGQTVDVRAANDRLRLLAA